MKYKVLSQRSSAYCAKEWRELDDLYEGGYQLRRNAKDYLPKLPGESEERWGARQKMAAYICYLGEIVDYFASALFAQDLSVTEAADADDITTPGGKSDTGFYAVFNEDADLQGNSFAQLEKDVFKTAILKKKGLLACDFPAVADPQSIISQADEDAVGARRAYCFEVPVEQLIDWECDKFGTFKFAILYTITNERSGPEAMRGDAVVEEFKVWRAPGPGEKGATWEIYRITHPADKPVDAEVDVPLVGRGETTFRTIPLIQFDVPGGLWVGNKIGTMALEHFQRRSASVAAQYKSLVAIPYVKRGPEITPVGVAMPAEAVQQDPYRGRNPVGQMNAKGWVEIGNQDELGFAEPSGHCYELTKEELKELKTEMFRVVHQMAASVDQTSGMQNRSGASKKEDRSAESRVLAAFGTLIREHAKKVFTAISLARGENVVWTPRGLDRFETDDRAELLQESVQVDMVQIPSKTFKQEYKTQLALRLVSGAPAETQDVIRQEILEGVEAEDDLRQMMLEADPMGLGMGAQDEEDPPPSERAEDKAKKPAQAKGAKPAPSAAKKPNGKARQAKR